MLGTVGLLCKSMELEYAKYYHKSSESLDKIKFCHLLTINYFINF